MVLFRNRTILIVIALLIGCEIIGPKIVQAQEDLLFKLTMGHEQIAIIQNISSSRQTFVVRLGAKDGISRNMQALFSTEKVSILCRALEVAHDYSLWKVDEKLATIPFQKGEYVVYSSSLETIWTKIPALKDKLAIFLKNREIPERPYWIARGAFSMGMYESVSEASATSTKSRTGQQFALMYTFNFSKSLDWGVGGRFDNESALLDVADLEVPTQRYFLVSELTYRFPNIKGTNNYFFMTAGVGIGLSSTTIDEVSSTGQAAILPAFHIGLMTMSGSGKGFLVEGVLESITQKEEFADGTKQTTNIVNAKLGLGFRF